METDDLIIPDVVVRSRRRWVRPGPIGAVLALLAYGALLAQATELFWLVLFVAAVLFVDLLRLARGRPGALRIGAAGLSFTSGDAVERVPAAAVDRVSVYARAGAFHLRVEPRAGLTWDVALPAALADAPAVGVECAERLGLGPHQRRMEFRNPVGIARVAVSWLIGATLGVIVGTVALIQLGRHWDEAAARALFYALVVGLTLLVGRATRTIDLVVGADGIELRGPWRRRYLSFNELEAVIWREGVLELGLRDAPTQRVMGTSLIDDDVMASAFVHAVRGARARHAQRRRDTELGALLARGDRPLAAWRASLRQIAGGAASYRAQALTPDELVRLLEDASADAELRVGAALALVATNDDGERTRVRVAAEASADPATRAALAGVVDDRLDDAALAALRRR